MRRFGAIDWRRRAAWSIVALAAAWILAPGAFAAGGCISDPSTCTAPPLSCTNRSSTGGLDNCGRLCNKGTFNNACQSTGLTSCDQLKVSSTKICGGDCTDKFNTGRCVPDGLLKCGEEGPGHRAICSGIVCTATGSCDSSSTDTWKAYGFIKPGDSLYGFPAVTQDVQDDGDRDTDGDGDGDSTGDGDGDSTDDSRLVPLYADPLTKDLLGLAAKGNIIIGDYTSDRFKDAVLPNLRPGDSSKTQPYEIDASDEDLGYANASACSSSTPCTFDGNYDQVDKDGLKEGEKMEFDRQGPDFNRSPIAAGARRFYESTLPDGDPTNPKEGEFRYYVDQYLPRGTEPMTIDAVLYTNHALAGFVPSSEPLTINGAMVSRDDGLVMNGSLIINHDVRLREGGLTSQIVLPLSMQRPRLVGFQDCGEQC